MTNMNKQEMRDFVAEHCLIKDADIQLSNGGASDSYFDCKRATMRGNFLPSLADWVLDIARDVNPSPDIIGGLTMGADFIAAAVVMRAAQIDSPLSSAAIVRKEPKKHGTMSLIENAPDTPSRVLIVDDVITTGRSIGLAADALLSAGHSIAAIVAIVDREQGGVAFLEEKYNTRVVSLFTKSNFATPQ